MANEIISTDVVPVNTNNQVVTGDTFDYEKKIAALSPAERESYLEIGKKLDVHDMNSIQAYGSEVSSIVSKNGDVLLNTVRAEMICLVNLTVLTMILIVIPVHTAVHSSGSGTVCQVLRNWQLLLMPL